MNVNHEDQESRQKANKESQSTVSSSRVEPDLSEALASTDEEDGVHALPVRSHAVSMMPALSLDAESSCDQTIPGVSPFGEEIETVAATAAFGVEQSLEQLLAHVRQTQIRVRELDHRVDSTAFKRTSTLRQTHEKLAKDIQIARMQLAELHTTHEQVHQAEQKQEQMFAVEAARRDDMQSQVDHLRSQLHTARSRKKRRESKRAVTYHFLGEPGDSNHVKLPAQVVEAIFSFLSLRGAELASQTCTQWRKCVIKTAVWGQLSCRNISKYEARTRELMAHKPDSILEQMTSDADRGFSAGWLALDADTPPSGFWNALKPKNEAAAGAGSGSVVGGPSGDAVGEKHRHFELTIEVPRLDDYVLEVREMDDAHVAQCGKPKAKEKEDKPAKKNSFSIVVCGRLPRGLELEYSFCRRVISQQGILAYCKMDAARLHAQLDDSDGVKRLLKKEIDSTTKLL